MLNVFRIHKRPLSLRALRSLSIEATTDYKPSQRSKHNSITGIGANSFKSIISITEYMYSLQEIVLGFPQ
ncbi:MAG: hypothetical protein QW803_13225 [Candidatus Methanomethylicia archaeon]